VALVIAMAALVVEAHALDTPIARAFPALVALGVTFALIRVVLTVATTHGTGHVLFATPSFVLPRLLGGFRVGGTVELAVVLQSASEGFAIVGVMAAFGAFNAVVSHYELVQAAPRAFYEPGLVVTVALAFVPSTVAAVRAVREADRARTGGRVVRRGRLVRLVVPILESGLERAVLLSESMDSRGFGHEQPGHRERASAWLGLGSLLALGGAFVALVARARWSAAILGLAGAAGVVAAVFFASQGAARPRHRPPARTALDRLVSAVVLLAPCAVAVLAAAGDHSLVWNVSPLRAPAFHPLVGLSILPLGVPALLARPALARVPSFAIEPEAA
jgi:energy-coupling factor transport system permease protein